MTPDGTWATPTALTGSVDARPTPSSPASKTTPKSEYRYRTTPSAGTACKRATCNRANRRPRSPARVPTSSGVHAGTKASSSQNTPPCGGTRNPGQRWPGHQAQAVRRKSPPEPQLRRKSLRSPISRKTGPKGPQAQLTPRSAFEPTSAPKPDCNKNATGRQIRCERAPKPKTPPETFGANSAQLSLRRPNGAKTLAGTMSTPLDRDRPVRGIRTTPPENPHRRSPVRYAHQAHQDPALPGREGPQKPLDLQRTVHRAAGRARATPLPPGCQEAHRGISATGRQVAGSPALPSRRPEAKPKPR